jgi:hypothetical protein
VQRAGRGRKRSHRGHRGPRVRAHESSWSSTSGRHIVLHTARYNKSRARDDRRARSATRICTRWHHHHIVHTRGHSHSGMHGGGRGPLPCAPRIDVPTLGMWSQLAMHKPLRNHGTIPKGPRRPLKRRHLRASRPARVPHHDRGVPASHDCSYRHLRHTWIIRLKKLQANTLIVFPGDSFECGHLCFTEVGHMSKLLFPCEGRNHRGVSACKV